jgi:hypothetical protein
MMIAEAEKSGDAKKAAEYSSAAESFANRLIAVEREVEDLKATHLASAQAAEQAKAAVQQNATVLQRRLSERQKLLSQLDQAKMQEQMNSAMASLNETVGQDVPTFTEVQEKIEARYAKAKGMSELNSDSVEGRMLEIEQAAMNTEARPAWPRSARASDHERGGPQPHPRWVRPRPSLPPDRYSATGQALQAPQRRRGVPLDLVGRSSSRGKRVTSDESAICPRAAPAPPPGRSAVRC